MKSYLPQIIFPSLTHSRRGIEASGMVFPEEPNMRVKGRRRKLGDPSIRLPREMWLSVMHIVHNNKRTQGGSFSVNLKRNRSSKLWMRTRYFQID